MVKPVETRGTQGLEQAAWCVLGIFLFLVPFIYLLLNIVKTVFEEKSINKNISHILTWHD